ncbi:hypothetical protein TNCV_4178731 [Trichonephila clavipes]|nr:hypothetical protein TNCV_4178731 [Trichonephila clavipes]
MSAANRVPDHGVLSTNDVKDSNPTSGLFPPTSDTSKTLSVTTPSCHIPPTNEETLSHLGPSTSGYIQQGNELDRHRVLTYDSELLTPAELRLHNLCT